MPNNGLGTVLDQPITNPTDASVRLKGTVTGGGLDISIDTGVARGGAFVEYWLLLMPQGLTAPANYLDQTKGQYDEFSWYNGLMDMSPGSDQVAVLRQRLQTKRRIERGFRMVCSVQNQGTTWSAGATGRFAAELYVAED